MRRPSTRRPSRGATVLGTAVLLACAPPAGGCFWLALGGAGWAGYELGTDEREAGAQIDDAAVTSRVKTRLLADEDVEGMAIDVDTWEGIVTLSGRVETRAMAARAERIARGTKGVKGVRNRLEVRQD